MMKKNNNSNNCLQKITIIVLISRIGIQIPYIKSYRSRILRMVAFHLSE